MGRGGGRGTEEMGVQIGGVQMGRGAEGWGTLIKDT